MTPAMTIRDFLSLNPLDWHMDLMLHGLGAIFAMAGFFRFAHKVVDPTVSKKGLSEFYGIVTIVCAFVLVIQSVLFAVTVHDILYPLVKK